MVRMAKASDWAKRVEAWRASGQRASEFCKGREYSAKRLQWWSWHLGRKGVRGSLSSHAVTLARVVRKPDWERAPNAAAIMVHVGAVRVDVTSGADRAALATVLDVLTSSSGARS